MKIRWRIFWNRMDGCLYEAFYEGGQDEPRGTLWSIQIEEEEMGKWEKKREGLVLEVGYTFI